MTTSSAIAARPRGAVPSGFKRLALGALGIVFGDIGTSPLYAFQQIFSGAHDIGVQEPRVFGAVSLVFWTLTLIVTVKYVLIVMRADNDGEGGIMALTALIQRIPALTRRSTAVLMGLGVFGAALFYGDGMVTPAVSVMSAVEGIEIVAPNMTELVVPLSVGVLVVLFACQRIGTGKVGSAFGPVMLVWFATIAVLGAVSIAQTPEILTAISPTHAFSLILAEPLVAFLSLGSVVLCVTGAEALYADMGHFGRGPIRLSWFAVATPALYLNYFGQAALVVRDPTAADNPFYLLVPHALLWPMIILATLATVIASQAVISGAFSMTEAAIQLRYLPRMTVRHTSASERGQIYVPMVNWALCIVVVGLVVGFQNSDNLASAYGIAVTGTFVITTVLITVVARLQWRQPLWRVVPIAGFFLFLDLSFFIANLTKFDHGGWFPLASAAIVFTLLMTWSRGRRRLADVTLDRVMDDDQFTTFMAGHDVPIQPGTSIYVSFNARLPLSLTEYLQMGGSLEQNSVHLAILSDTHPYVPDDEKVSLVRLDPHLTRVVATYGFMEAPDVVGAMRLAVAAGLDVPLDGAVVVVHSARALATSSPGMWRWSKHLFAFMLRNSTGPSTFLRVPPDRAVEWTSLVKL